VPSGQKKYFKRGQEALGCEKAEESMGKNVKRILNGRIN
jgi:hypothetical protein